jgi:DNA-binding NtrC family response regulator
MQKGQPTRKCRILVVDDEEDVRTLLTTLIEKMGHESVETGRAKDALTLIERGKADLMLLDLNMPGVTGLELLKLIRRRRIMIPVVVVSAHVSAEIAKELSNLNIQGVLAKPFKRDRFEALIRKLTGAAG